MCINQFVDKFSFVGHSFWSWCMFHILFTHHVPDDSYFFARSLRWMRLQLGDRSCACRTCRIKGHGDFTQPSFAAQIAGGDADWKFTTRFHRSLRAVARSENSSDSDMIRNMNPKEPWAFWLWLKLNIKPAYWHRLRCHHDLLFSSCSRHWNGNRTLRWQKQSFNVRFCALTMYEYVTLPFLLGFPRVRTWWLSWWNQETKMLYDAL